MGEGKNGIGGVMLPSAGVSPPVVAPRPETFEEMQARMHAENLGLTERLHQEGIASQMAQYEAQQRAAQEKRARSSSLISQINAAFNGREDIYDNYRDLTYNANVDELNNRRDDSQRQIKFGLGRSGLAGGSVDTDMFAKSTKAYDKGLIQAQGYADSQASALRGQDQAMKSNLIGLASTGNVDSGIMGGLQNSLASTAQQAQTPAINPSSGNEFGGIADALGSALYQIGSNQGARSTSSPYSNKSRSSFNGKVS